MFRDVRDPDRAVPEVNLRFKDARRAHAVIAGDHVARHPTRLSDASSASMSFSERPFFDNSRSSTTYVKIHIRQGGGPRELAQND